MSKSLENESKSLFDPDKKIIAIIDMQTENLKMYISNSTQTIHHF